MQVQLLSVVSLVCLLCLSSTGAAPISSSSTSTRIPRSPTTSGSALTLAFQQHRFQKPAPKEWAKYVQGADSSVDAHTRPLERRQAASDTEAPVYNLDDARYLVDITIAGQDLQVILDTGSTDTFVYSHQPSNQIGTAATEPPVFDNATASPLYDTGFEYVASYGAGNGVTQTKGAVQLTDISFPNTDLEARNLSFANIWTSTNGVSASGLLGLGFPINGNIWSDAVLAIYEQTKQTVSQAVSSSWFPIVPLLQYEGDVSNAMFSLVLTRMGPQGTNNPKTSGGTLPMSPQAVLSSGSLTIGGYPPGYGESDFTWSPVPYVTVSNTYKEYGFPSSTGNRWTTQLQAIYFNGVQLIESKLQPEASSNYALIDTGNPIMNIASDVLAQITNAWASNPDNYVLPCDTAFDLVFQFAGRNFTLAKEDVLVPSNAAIDSNNYGGYATQDCQAQMQPFTPTSNEIGPDTSQTHQLGDVFLRNVVTSYDYGNLYNAASSPPRIGFISTTPAA